MKGAITKEGREVAAWMIGQLSYLTRGYRNIVIGCYKSAIQNSGYAEPTDGEGVIVDYVIEIMKSL